MGTQGAHGPYRSKIKNFRKCAIFAGIQTQDLKELSISTPSTTPLCQAPFLSSPFTFNPIYYPSLPSRSLFLSPSTFNTINHPFIRASFPSYFPYNFNAINNLPLSSTIFIPLTRFYPPFPTFIPVYQPTSSSPPPWPHLEIQQRSTTIDLDDRT